MKYDKYMDKECIELCNELNSLKGVKTFESCCGHYKQPYIIFMTISNFYSLSLLARAFDIRYSSGKWAIKISSTDTPRKKSGIENVIKRAEPVSFATVRNPIRRVRPPPDKTSMFSKRDRPRILSQA